MSEWDAASSEPSSGWQADDATQHASQTFESTFLHEGDFASPDASRDDTSSSPPHADASHDLTTSDNVSTVGSVELNLSGVEDATAQGPALLQLAPFTEHYDPDETEFSRFVFERDFAPGVATPKEEEDPQKLIEVLPKDSENAKEFNGTQWKNAHFLLHVIGPNNIPEQKYLPFSWIQKQTGVNMRARVCGANLARKLVIELSVYQDSNMVHKAFLEIHAHTHVREYEFVNRTVKEFRRNRRRKPDEHDNATLQNSFVIVRIVTNGGIGIGLDFNADFLDEEDRQLLWYARQLATNFNEDNSPKRMIFRLNARYIEYELQNANTKRKTEEQDRFLRHFENFMEGTRQILAPYRDANGKPICQWGQFVKRQIVADESNGLVPFPSYSSFATLDEFRIILTYGLFLEWKQEADIARSISRRQHGVSFFIVKPSTVLALVRFDLPESVNIDHFTPRENAAIKIQFRPPNKINLGDVRCTGIMVHNVFGLPFPTGTLFLIPGASVPFYSAFAIEVGQQPRFLPAKVTISVPHSGAQRQVDSINRLCTPLPHLGELSNVALNREAGLRRRINPFSGLDLPPTTVQAAIDEVLQSGIEWSEGQIACIESIKSLPNGVLLIEGYPGTGKTFTLVAIASILIALGIHVVFTAPSHYAADAICDAMDKWAESTGTDLHPLRIYRPVSESRAFRTHGRSRARHADDEEDIELDAIEEDTEEFAVCESTPNVANSEFVPTFIPLEDQIRISEVLNAIKDKNNSRYYGIPAKSLEAHVFRMAYTEGRQLIDTFPSEEQMMRSRGDLFDSIEAGDLDPEGEEADMLQVLRDYVELIQEQNFRQLDQDTKRKALLAFRKASKQVIREAFVVVSTNNNMGDPIVSSNFGVTANAIFVIRDEDPKELEPNGWIPITKLKEGSKLKGLITCGDAKQLRPMVLSLQSSVRYNEFAQQLAVSFPSRLITMHHPVVKLTEQFRFRPCFLRWLNHRTYDGEMKSHQSTATITVNPLFMDVMQKILNLKDTGNLDLGNVVISVNESTCEKEPGSNSRFNDANRLWVLKLIMENFRAGAYPGEAIVIITPYTAQVVRYRQSLFSLLQRGMLPYSELPKVATTDSMQGKEAKVVIYDWVITSANSFGDMGFTIDDHRGNVGMSRMCEVMVNIIPSSVGSDTKSVDLPPRYNYLGERIKSKVPYPCAFVQWHVSEKNLVTVDCPHEEDVFPVIPDPHEEDAFPTVPRGTDDTSASAVASPDANFLQRAASSILGSLSRIWSPGTNAVRSPPAAGATSDSPSAEATLKAATEGTSNTLDGEEEWSPSAAEGTWEPHATEGTSNSPIAEEEWSPSAAEGTW